MSMLSGQEKAAKWEGSHCTLQGAMKPPVSPQRQPREEAPASKERLQPQPLAGRSESPPPPPPQGSFWGVSHGPWCWFSKWWFPSCPFLTKPFIKIRFKFFSLAFTSLPCPRIKISFPSFEWACLSPSVFCFGNCHICSCVVFFTDYARRSISQKAQLLRQRERRERNFAIPSFPKSPPWKCTTNSPNKALKHHNVFYYFTWSRTVAGPNVLQDQLKVWVGESVCLKPPSGEAEM